MEKFMCILVVVLLLIFVSVAGANNLFVMGWDGAGMNNIVPLLKQGKLPNLQSIIDSGGCLVHIEPITRTQTLPNWTAMWTGLTYDQSWVRSNQHWDIVLSYGTSIVKSIQDSGHRTGWFVSKTYLSNNDARTPLSRIARYADMYSLKSPSKDGEYYGDILTSKVIKFISENRDYLVFLHVNPDYYGHIAGENSERYLHEFRRADNWLGQILPYIDRANTKIIIISDHGFDEGLYSHSDAPDNFMVTNLDLKNFYCPGETTGTMRDVANTILDYFNILPTKAMRGKSFLSDR